MWFTEARYWVVGDPPENERLWFTVVALRISASSQSVLAWPRPARTVGDTLPAWTCSLTNALKSEADSTGTCRLREAFPAETSYSTEGPPAEPFFVSMTTTPFAARVP